MVDSTVALGIVGISLAINVILFIKIVQLKKELDQVKHSTRLTREEVQKLNERLGKLKSL
jgi:type II secretory pathway pseudopilin PulG